MKTVLLLLFISPIGIFAQATPKIDLKITDSLLARSFYKSNVANSVPIPNMKLDSAQKFFGLISKSKGNAIEIPNVFKVLPAKEDSKIKK